MKKITKVSMKLVLDQLTPMRKASFTFPMETRFLGVKLSNDSKLIISYMAPEKNFKKTGEYEGYDFVVLSLEFNAFTIPDDLEFFCTFHWKNSIYGVFFRKCTLWHLSQKSSGSLQEVPLLFNLFIYKIFNICFLHISYPSIYFFATL